MTNFGAYGMINDMKSKKHSCDCEEKSREQRAAFEYDSYTKKAQQKILTKEEKENYEG